MYSVRSQIECARCGNLTRRFPIKTGQELQPVVINYLNRYVHKELH